MFSGDSVDIDHKRSLYRVIVGKDGVKLAKEIEDLDAASRAKATDIREKVPRIQAVIPKGTTLDDVPCPRRGPGCRREDCAKENELDAVKQADEISKKPKLSTLTLPALPAGFADVLARTVDGIAEDAEKRVKAQIAAHGMHARGQTWLSEGVGYRAAGPMPVLRAGSRTGRHAARRLQGLFQQGLQRPAQRDHHDARSVETALGDQRIAAFEKDARPEHDRRRVLVAVLPASAP